MSKQTQVNDINELPFAEQVRLIISEQFFIMRCSAVPASDSGDGFVDCTLPNCSLQLISGNTKRIKKTIVNVPIGNLNGAKVEFPDDGLHGILFVSNYPTNEIETATIADLSCVNVSGEKCLFIPATYEGELAKEVLQAAAEKYSIEAPKISIGNGSTTELVAIESNQYQIMLDYIAVISANIGGVASGSAPSVAAIVAGGVTATASLTADKILVDGVKV